ncbi:uncharacterized protein TNCV_2127651 [Trichonephila clavipes]|nr:uncharacterized protein TNCV_2127651 [Trichonephila clavipes]
MLHGSHSVFSYPDNHVSGRSTFPIDSGKRCMTPHLREDIDLREIQRASSITSQQRRTSRTVGDESPILNHCQVMRMTYISYHSTYRIPTLSQYKDFEPQHV